MNQIIPKEQEISKRDNQNIVIINLDDEGYEKLSNFDLLLKKAMKHKYYLDLGGIEGIKELAKRVYQYHVQDVRINTFFDFTMIYRFEQMLINFLVGLLGGKPYNQRSMRKAHRRLGGLSNEHFDAFVENLLNAMKHQKVDNVAIREILHLVEETREDVTGLNESERRNYKEDIKPTTSCPFHFSLKNKTKSKKSCSIT